jgi:hypothetical protein
MRVLESNATNFLVRNEDGSITTKTRDSDLNKLLFGHNLYGLIEEGSSVWTNSGSESEPKVTLIPDDEAKSYTLRLDNAPDLTLGPHYKTDLIEALAAVYEQHNAESVAPLLSLYDDVRENMIRKEVLEPFSRVFSDKVEVRDDGWFINGHLLLTFEGDFFHPNTTSRERSGGNVTSYQSQMQAYSVDISEGAADMSRDVTLNGESFRLTDTEMEFLGKLVWSIENTPDRR